MIASENTGGFTGDRPEQDPTTGQFVPGNSGRPKGSVNRRTKLANYILDALDKKPGGAVAFLDGLEDQQFVALLSRLIPKEQKIEQVVPEGCTFTLNIGTAGRDTKPPAGDVVATGNPTAPAAQGRDSGVD